MYDVDKPGFNKETYSVVCMSYLPR